MFHMNRELLWTQLVFEKVAECSGGNKALTVKLSDLQGIKRKIII